MATATAIATAPGLKAAGAPEDASYRVTGGDRIRMHLSGTTPGSRYIDLLSKEVAGMVVADPTLLDAARQNIQSTPSEWSETWESILDGGIDVVTGVLRSKSNASRPLRVASPVVRVAEISASRRLELYQLAL